MSRALSGCVAMNLGMPSVREQGRINSTGLIHTHSPLQTRYQGRPLLEGPLGFGFYSFAE